MGRKNPKHQSGGYKGITDDGYDHLKDNPQETVTIQNNNNKNNYVIVGNARKTRTGNSLGMDVIIDGEHHFLTILKVHIDALFDGRMMLAHIREYPPINNNDITNNEISEDETLQED